MTEMTPQKNALDALEELAHVPMELSLADWSRICSTIRAGLQAAQVPEDPYDDPRITNAFLRGQEPFNAVPADRAALDALDSIAVTYNNLDKNLAAKKKVRDYILSQAALMQGGVAEWQKIETAPKDGKCVIGYFPCKSGYVADQRFIPIHWTEWGDGCWENTTSGHKVFEKPTHWQPLPQPPREGE